MITYKSSSGLSEALKGDGEYLLGISTERSNATPSSMPYVNTYTLSALQVLCHLFTTENHSYVPDSVPALTQSPYQYQTQNLLPNGYVLDPDIGIAFKYHNQSTPLLEARKICQDEGAQLAVIDSVKRMDYVKRKIPDVYVHAGIIRMDGTTWVSVNTGLPLSSLVWHPGYPTASSNCVQIHPSNSGLTNIYNCGNPYGFLCELPILPNSSPITAN